MSSTTMTSLAEYVLSLSGLCFDYIDDLSILNNRGASVRFDQNPYPRPPCLGFDDARRNMVSRFYFVFERAQQYLRQEDPYRPMSEDYWMFMEESLKKRFLQDDDRDNHEEVERVVILLLNARRDYILQYGWEINERNQVVGLLTCFLLGLWEACYLRGVIVAREPAVDTLVNCPIPWEGIEDRLAEMRDLFGV